MVPDPLQQVPVRQRLFLCRLGIFFGLDELLLDRLQVGEPELGVDGFNVADRIDLAGNVRHVVIFEAPHNVGDRVGFTDVAEKLVAKPFAF